MIHASTSSHGHKQKHKHHGPEATHISPHTARTSDHGTTVSGDNTADTATQDITCPVMAQTHPLLTPHWPAEPDQTQAIEWLGLLYRIRKMEEAVAGAYTEGKIGGFCHLCIGQEAVSVALAYGLQSQDTVVTAYRAHGHGVALGLSEEEVMAELMGKVRGCSLGKGGSMHIFHPQKGFYGGHGIVGAQIPIGTGLGFAHAYTQDNGVCVTLLGDGASNQGQFFESMNMAALWHLPVVYVIENNGYAMGTSVERACAGGPLHQRGRPFGIPGAMVCGHDTVKVYQAVTAAVQHVRHMRHPFVLEIDTYRFKGHSMSDPAKYRTRQELDAARAERDPIKHLRHYMQNRWNVETQTLQHIETGASTLIQEALHRVEAMPFPEAAILHNHVLI